MERDAVMIVGAGPTGLTLACALRNAGVPARVVDAADGPAVTSRALGLQPRGVEVLDRLGALADLPERSLRVNQVIVSVSGRELTRLRVGERTRLGGRPGLLMSQAAIEGALRRRLADLGGEVEWSRPVTGVQPEADGVVVRLGDGEAVRVGWLVGCDGAHSSVRKAAGIGFAGVPLAERFLIADVRADLALPRDAVSVWLRGHDMLAAFPLPGEQWRIMTPAPPGDAGDLDPAAVLARVRTRVFEETGGTVHDAVWTSSFRIQRRLADTYRRGRVLLAGDAAHIHSPLGGQGMNTGIGDAENLAWKLALVVAGRADERLVDTYEAERRPVAADVLSATSGATNVMFGDGTLSRLVRDHVVVPVMNRPFVQRRIAERSSQLLVSYRRGPLGRSQGWRRWWLSRPRPGDRVPDLPCRRADGTPSRLHAELRGRWAVLAPPSSAPSLLDVASTRLGRSVVELSAWPSDSVASGSGHRGDVLLVRPDGHLAWRGTAAASLERWLVGALGRPAPVRVALGAGRPPA
jgi:4,5-epoxidase